MPTFYFFSVTIGEPGWRVAMDLDANQTYITTNSVNFSNCPVGVTEGVALRSGSSVNVSGVLFSMVGWPLNILIEQSKSQAATTTLKSLSM